MTRPLPASSPSATATFTPITRSEGIGPYHIDFAREKRTLRASWDSIAQMLGCPTRSLRETCRAAGVE